MVAGGFAGLPEIAPSVAIPLRSFNLGTIGDREGGSVALRGSRVRKIECAKS
jgi:hypothetical protein